MMHITLNAILRAVFGADGAELDELRRLIPPWVTLGSRLAAMPKPKRNYGRYSPWGRLDEWRRQYDVVIDKLIDAERADPNFADRTDVLALMLRSTYDDGSVMSRKDIGDELLTLLAAGHETTASTLALGVRADDPAPGPAGGPGRRGRQRRQRAAPGHDPGSPTGQDGHRFRRPPASIRRSTNSANGSFPAGIRSSSASGRYTTTPTSSPTRNASTRNATSEASRRPSRGFRSAAAPAGVWAPHSPTWRWTWCFEQCCATSLSRPPTAPGEQWHCRGVAYTPKDGGRIVVRRR